MTRLFKLTTVSQTGATATSQFEGALQAEKRLREAQEDRTLRYILVVEVLDDGQTDLYDELWIPPDGTVANGLGTQAVARGPVWEISARDHVYRIPIPSSLEGLLGNLLTVLGNHGRYCHQEGIAEGRAQNQAELRKLIGAAAVGSSGETR